MRSRYAVAPVPPAAPGMVPEDGATDHYLSELARWRIHRDHELRALDALTRTHADREDLNADITFSMTLWHSIVQRHDLLLSTWQDTKEGTGQQEWVARLIWGVLELPDGDGQALAIALPEALRLSDALAASLRARVRGDDELPLEERLSATQQDLLRVRAGVESADPAVGGRLTERLVAAEELAAELTPTSDDALGRLGQLESATALLERDLIIAGTSAVHARADAGQAQDERDHLVARGEAVRSLAERVLNTLRPAPRLGIPDVTALGEVPTDENDLAAYVANLERVGRALDQAHTTYAAALAEYADLVDRAERLGRTLAGCGAPTSVDLAGMLTATKQSLHNRPADIQRASALVASQEAYLGQLRPDA
ncbi:hypothetical protein [Ornithinimicrobium cerasi]|uniref:hypothetical protein n=1 Tax=Ornithinimicrobium cerasi TaxID=2248773 RepID=UPI00137AF386|nr:hypothetical protein [Ornithinimicrobium cerasi]